MECIIIYYLAPAIFKNQGIGINKPLHTTATRATLQDELWEMVKNGEDLRYNIPFMTHAGIDA